MASSLEVGSCLLSPFAGLAGLMMLAGAYRQGRPGPRALAWGTVSLVSLLPTTFALNATADQPGALAVCSVVCAPFVLALFAVTVYHGLKARAEFSGPIAAPLATSVSKTPTSSPAEESLAWLEALAAKQGAKPEELITQPQTHADKPPARTKPEPTGIPDLPSLPDTQSALDQLSQALESSKQTLDDMLRSPVTEIGTAQPSETGASSKARDKKNRCPHCGAELSGAPGQGFIFCYHCGSQVNL